MNGKYKLKAIFGLCLIFIALTFNLLWLWGVLFLLMFIQAVIKGETHLLEHITRQQNPVLFWIIELTWLFVSLYIIAYDLKLLSF